MARPNHWSPGSALGPPPFTGEEKTSTSVLKLLH